MRQQSSQFTVPDWAKWTSLIIGVLFLLVFAVAVWLYVQINQDRTAGYEAAERVAVEQTDLVQVDNVSSYFGEQVVHIVKGVNEEKEVTLAFLNLENSEVLDVVSGKDLLSLEQMKAKWNQNCTDCQFEQIQYAFEEGQPVYEVTYIDEKNRYVFNYYKLNGETFDQRFAFKQTK